MFLNINIGEICKSLMFNVLEFKRVSGFRGYVMHVVRLSDIYE